MDQDPQPILIITIAQLFQTLSDAVPYRHFSNFICEVLFPGVENKELLARLHSPRTKVGSTPQVSVIISSSSQPSFRRQTPCEYNTSFRRQTPCEYNTSFRRQIPAYTDSASFKRQTPANTAPHSGDKPLTAPLTCHLL